MTSVAFDPVGNRVLAASIDGRVGVWDAATRLRPVGAHDVVSAGEDGVVIRWTGPGGPAAWWLDVIGAPIWGLGL